jgi:hypothetical protein
MERAMSDSGYASLGPTLLARKGGAKPAMRPQLPVLSDPGEVAKLADEKLEDLGWNDMGEEPEACDPAVGVVVPIDPDTPFDPAAIAASPIVRRQQRRLEERVLADAVMTGPEDVEPEYDDGATGGFEYEACAPATDDLPAYEDETEVLHAAYVPAEPLPEMRPAKSAKAQRKATAPHARRAAFTLRLDPERHLKLRLAATVRGVSAQALVTDALDALLAEFEDLDAIAAHLQRH